MNVVKKLNINEFQMDSLIKTDENFDIIKRKLVVGNRNSTLYYIDGFIKDELLQEVIRFMLLTEPGNMTNVNSASDYIQKLMPFMEINTESDFEKIKLEILSGCVILFVDDIDEAIIIDSRQYPQRQIEEPESDKVLRGPKDGFIETPIFNITLIRRRIRNENLRFEYYNMGSETNNDVVLCYMSNKVNQKKLKIIKDKLNRIKPKDLTMGIVGLVEEMHEKGWHNPFPKVRYTGRPDVVAASIMEGKMVLLVDNTPCAAILPTYFIEFFQEAEDFYFPPPTGTYLKISRFLIVFLSLFLTPLWLLAVKNMELLPEWLSFLKPEKMNSIPLVIQLIALEFIIDTIKSASINTPGMISSSISLIGAVILRRCSNNDKLNYSRSDAF